MTAAVITAGAVEVKDSVNAPVDRSPSISQTSNAPTPMPSLATARPTKAVAKDHGLEATSADTADAPPPPTVPVEQSPSADESAGQSTAAENVALEGEPDSEGVTAATPSETAGAGTHPGGGTVVVTVAPPPPSAPPAPVVEPEPAPPAAEPTGSVAESGGVTAPEDGEAPSPAVP